MRLQYYVDEDGESTIGLWVPKRGCFIDVTAQDEQLWAAMLPGGKKLRKEIETWISKGAEDGVAVDMKELAISSALHVQPCTLACLGKCYADHAREFSGDTPTEPSLFLKATSAISSDLSYVLNPEGATKLDYEVELAVIIGDTLHRASEAEARRAIVGYTLMPSVPTSWNTVGNGSKARATIPLPPLAPCWSPRMKFPTRTIWTWNSR